MKKWFSLRVLGIELAKADRYEKAKVAIARKYPRDPRRNIVRLGTGKDGLIISCEILPDPRWAGDVPLGRWLWRPRSIG